MKREKLYREKPYKVVQGSDGVFVASSGSEPIDSPAIALRTTTSMYKKLEEVALKKKAEWIRQAVKEKLEREQYTRAKVAEESVEAIDDQAMLPEAGCPSGIAIRKNKPYEVVQGEDGTFVATGSEPIDSPVMAIRMTSSMYEQFVAVAGKKKTEWIRQAIKEKLEREKRAVFVANPSIAALQGEDGTFVEPIDSSAIALSLPSSTYEKLDIVAGKDKAEWIREAIKRRLEQDYPET